MTDGHVTCHGVEVSRLDGISLNTHPGTKVRVSGGGRIAVTNGTLMLETGCLKVLGGRVEGITDKWEVQKKLSNFTRATHNRKIDQSGDSSSGPPPWIPFGRKIQMGSSEGSQEKDASLIDKVNDVIGILPIRGSHYSGILHIISNMTIR